MLWSWTQDCKKDRVLSLSRIAYHLSRKVLNSKIVSNSVVYRFHCYSLVYFFSFNDWDYAIILSSLPFCSSSKTSIYFSLISFQFITSFLIAFLYIHVCVHTHIFVNITILICIHVTCIYAFMSEGWCYLNPKVCKLFFSYLRYKAYMNTPWKNVPNALQRNYEYICCYRH